MTHVAYWAAVWSKGPRGDEKHRTCRTPQQEANNPLGDGATLVAYSDDPHGDPDSARVAFLFSHSTMCEVRASHDASTASVVVVVSTGASVARCGYEECHAGDKTTVNGARGA